MRFARLILLALVASLSSACVRHADTKATRRPKWIRWTIDRPKPLDDIQHALLVQEGLARVVTVEGEARAVPALAASWELSDPRTLVVKLRPGVEWSDGQPFVAAQVIESWQRVIARCRELPAAALLFPIARAKEICAGSSRAAELGVSSPDPATLVVTLTRPQPLFPLTLGHPALFPVREGSAATLGPFVAERSLRAGESRYVRNPRYRGPGPEIDGIVVRAIPVVQARVQHFIDNGTDFVDEAPDAIAGYPAGLAPLSPEADGHVAALVFNTAKKPFGHVALRQSVRQALQRDELLRLARLPHLAASGLLAFPPAGLARRVAPEPATAAAKAALAGLNLEPAQLRATLGWIGVRSGAEIAGNLQAQLITQLGLKVDIVGDVAPRPGGKTVTPASMTIVRWRADPLVPWRHLEWLASPAGEMMTHWKSAELEAALATARAGPTSEAVAAGLKAAEQILVDSEAIVVPLFHERRMVMRHGRVRNVRRSPFGAWDFTEAGFDIF